MAIHDALIPANSRRRLVDSDRVTAAELVARHDLPPSGDIIGRKLVVTYAGAFEFQVGRNQTWVDSGRILFANHGESYVDHHVVPDTGHASVILTPDDEMADQLWDGIDTGRVRAGTLKIQMLAQLLRRAVRPLAAQEIAIAMLEEAVEESRPVADNDPRCVRLAKAALHDCEEGRISLESLAADIGVTSVHLTQCFKRSEGVPLYRYQTQLRLGRALERLPESDDITDLAFELGFSSHSHFTAAFHEKVGITPSQFRQQARSA